MNVWELYRRVCVCVRILRACNALVPIGEGSGIAEGGYGGV